MKSSIEFKSIGVDHQSLPLVIETKDRRLQLSGWITENKERVEQLVLDHGGILFRGFRVNGSAHFERIIEEGFDQALLGYENRSTPRTQVRNKIYTSTEYPSSQSIPLHNENSYTSSWAKKIFFYCVLPSKVGGATPIADSRKVYAKVPREIRDRFERDGVMYRRNYDGLDLSWEEVFQTEDRNEMEAYCNKSGIDFEWVSEDHLQTYQVCPASLVHPSTGERVWFNQAQLFHNSSLNAEIRKSLLSTLGENGLPRNAYFGDGSVIPDEYIESIRLAYEQEKVTFPWASGDILLLDNMLTAHGRDPYEGKRKVLVGMIEPFSSEVEP